jgi:acyl-ACP thioesterase
MAGTKVQARIEQPYRVRFDECGADGTLRSSGYLRYAQEMAWIHSERAGFDRDWYTARSLTWLVRCLELDLLEPIGDGDTIRASTEVVGFRRVWARRRSEFMGAADDRIRAVALTDWVLLGPKGPMTAPPELQDRFETPLVPFAPRRVPAVPVPADVHDVSFGVRRRDVDPLGHVNNATYLDYLEEVVAGADGERDLALLPRRYRLEYLVAAEPGTRLRARCWPVEQGWRFQLDGLGSLEGQTLLRATLETEPSAWVGG